MGIALVLNVSYNKNYFFNFIKKRLAEGYTVEDAEQKKLLEAAGVFDVAETPRNQTKAKGSIFAKLNALINKLPFSGFAAKIPVFQRFAKFANYAVCILAVLLLAGIFTSKSPTDAFIDDMEHIANSMTKTVDKCEAGDITYEEMQEKMLDLVAEVDEVGEKYKGKFKDSDLTTEQKRRLLKIMNDIERLQERGDKFLLQNYYY